MKIGKNPQMINAFWLREFSNLVHNLLFPEFCIGCGVYGSILCSNCFNEIELARTYTCFYCGKIVSRSKLCSNCRKKHGSTISEIVWASSYKDPIVKELIHEFKYNGVTSAGEILAEMLKKRMESLLEAISNPVVVPVPLHFSKFQKRGFNQAERIAIHISKAYGLSGGLALNRIRETATQVGLSRDKRQRNLSGAFVCCDTELIKDRNVIIIDDVATTGATLSECAKVLKKSGARRIYAAVVARG